MIAGIVATLITKQYIPDLNKDLVTATTELTKFRKINADWYKYGVPLLLVSRISSSAARNCMGSSAARPSAWSSA